MKKKVLLIIGGILVLFIITNPSASAFKEYIGTNTSLTLKRSVNLFICSIYKRGGTPYFGMVGNFWRIDEPTNQITQNKYDFSSFDRAVKDTTLMEMDTINKNGDYLPPPPPKKIIGHTKDGLPIFKK